jgi:hypothetical protein
MVPTEQQRTRVFGVIVYVHRVVRLRPRMVVVVVGGERRSNSGGDDIARLGGQRDQYLLKALRDFKAGARSGTGPSWLRW